MAHRGPPAFFLPIVFVALSATDCSPGSELIACAPGQQIACACGGGREGYQICWDDGAGYGACLGCGDAGGLPRVDSTASVDATMPVDAGSTTPDATVPREDASAPDVTAPDANTPDVTAPDVSAPDVSAPDVSVPDTSTPDVTAPDTGTTGVDSAAPTFAWVWVDRGGPAFQPHACRAGAGVVGGMLVDPAAFFSALVAGRDPNTWERVLNDIERELWSCGVGQQRGSAGNVRGRLFLPTAACPDASPPAGDTTAMRLGVRQESSCWSHPADVVMAR